MLKEEAVRALVDRALDPSLRDFNLDQRPAAQLDPESLFTLCTTLPMMAERRVVILREVEGIKRKPKLRAALVKYLEQPAAETVLAMVQSSGEEGEDKELARLSCAVTCDALPPERVDRATDHVFRVLSQITQIRQKNPRHPWLMFVVHCRACALSSFC